MFDYIPKADHKAQTIQWGLKYAAENNLDKERLAKLLIGTTASKQNIKEKADEKVIQENEVQSLKEIKLPQSQDLANKLKYIC